MTTQTKRARLIAALSRRWLTPVDALAECGILSLSQRCGDLRRDPDMQARGWTVVDKWVVLPSGSRVKAYRLVRPTRWAA